MKKGRVIYLIIIIIAVLFLWKQNIFYFVYSHVRNYITPIDNSYILKREWLSESGGAIIFNAQNEHLKNDTIFSQGVPYCKILRLNIDLNEITVYSFKKNKNITCTATEEFRK